MLNLHAIEPASTANGPGLRFVVWFQGCSLGCPGCFNPDTHSFEERISATPDGLLDRIEAERNRIDGVTITGGEPFDQREGLLAVARGLRRRTTLSLLVFSGYALSQIRGLPLGREILDCVDALVDGPFLQDQLFRRLLRGSGNQRTHLLTDRYRQEEVEATPVAELIISPSGRIRITGVDPLTCPARPIRPAMAATGTCQGWRTATIPES